MQQQHIASVDFYLNDTNVRILFENSRKKTPCTASKQHQRKYCSAAYTFKLGSLSNDDDDGSENVAKKMNLRSFKLNRVYLDSLNLSNGGDVSWS